MKNTLIPAVLAAASIANARVVKRDLTVQTIKNWHSLGCYTDSSSNRTLTQLSQVGDQVSDTTCQARCSQLGYLYAGTEYSGQCYCDNSIGSLASSRPDSECSMACTGDSTQPCGGPDRLNIFTRTNSATKNYGDLAGWNYVSCYSDSVYQRGLSHKVDTAGSASVMTPSTCTAACQAAGYVLASLEYGDECYCDNYIQNKQAAVSEASCNYPCAGDSSVVCGGEASMSLFTYGSNVPAQAVATSHAPTVPSDWSSFGCYTDDVSKRALSNYITAPSSGMTVEYCISSCKSAGFTYAGLEYAGECYCDNSIKNSQGPASDGSAGCSMACSGDSGEICGGSNRLSLYGKTPAKPKTTGLASGWTYEACFADSATNRILAVQQPDSASLTAEQCIATCSAAGYTVAGLEYSNQCFCGNAVQNYAGLAQGACSSVCTGDATETCGGAGAMDLYHSGDLQYVSPPVEQRSGLPGSWYLDGCFADSASQRVFSHELGQSNATPSTCINYCQAQGFPVAAVEYGSECFCGTWDEAANGLNTLSQQCNMACSGDSTIACGGYAAMDVYYNQAQQPSR